MLGLEGGTLRLKAPEVREVIGPVLTERGVAQSWIRRKWTSVTAAERWENPIRDDERGGLFAAVAVGMTVGRFLGLFSPVSG